MSSSDDKAASGVNSRDDVLESPTQTMRTGAPSPTAQHEPDARPPLAPVGSPQIHIPEYATPRAARNEDDPFDEAQMLEFSTMANSSIAGYSKGFTEAVRNSILRNSIAGPATVSDAQRVGAATPLTPPRSLTPVSPPLGTGGSFKEQNSPVYSKERAMKNFEKARYLIKEQLKRMHNQGQSGDLPSGHSAPPPPSSRTGADGPRSPTDDENGERIVGTIASVVEDADDDEEEEANETEQSTTSLRAAPTKMQDWRDDTNMVAAASNFFQSNSALATNSNRVIENIILRGHAAQTDEEMEWLFMNSQLLSLLTRDQIRTLAKHTLRREYTKGEIVLPDDNHVSHLRVIVWGEVDVFSRVNMDAERKEQENAFHVSSHFGSSANWKKARSISREIVELSLDAAAPNEGADDDTVMYSHIATIYPGQTFGIESCVFNEKSRYCFQAGGATSKTSVALIPIKCIWDALAANVRFAQGVGSCIAGSQDVFGPIRRFCRYVFSPATAQNEYLPLWSIVESYTKIQNVIHNKLFSKELDTGAWGYALGRLPSNLTTTFCFDLVHALPPFIASRMRNEARMADVWKSPDDGTDDKGKAARARTTITYITTKERRRCTWHLGMEGKTLVLLRDGFTDLLDFLTMLCVHIIESNKLRGRIQGMVHPPAIDVLDDYLRQKEEEATRNEAVPPETEVARIKNILKDMPLNENEQRGLFNNWKNDTLLRIYEIMMHREEFNVRLDPSISRRFQTNPFHEWAINLRTCVLGKLGLDRNTPLPDNIVIDVISSNTHCIKNLLCSFNRKYQKELLEHAVTHEGKKLGRKEEWYNANDMMYAGMPGFMKAVPAAVREEYAKSLEENDITVLHDTAMTGLQVDVIPVHSLDFSSIDSTIKEALVQHMRDKCPTLSEDECEHLWADVCQPVQPQPVTRKPSTASTPNGERNDGKTGKSSTALPRKSVTQVPPSAGCAHHPDGPVQRHKRHFIINMDFAFGAQAEGIARALFGAFGTRIQSVNVMGKAGGLVGKRGDIQLASHVLLSKSSLILEDNQDELRSCRNQGLTVDLLKRLAGPRVSVYNGKVLTVTGTMLQNVALLRYYQRVWRCVGTEMEGSYFARVIEDFYRQGIANSNICTRFAYYTSDLPLAQNDIEEEFLRTHRMPGQAMTLSMPMTPQEGVPPLYAIARGILANVLMSSFDEDELEESAEYKD